jgi:hypothetical protein
LETIEDIVLDHDGRGISALRPHVAPDFCTTAADLILDSPGTVFIVTGFYILNAGASETDGPPGAVVIGEGLTALGYEVVYVSDRYTVPSIEHTIGDAAPVIDFPITSDEQSEKFAADLLSRYSPSVVIAIERCGMTAQGTFHNMHGKDISAYNARTDFLFTQHDRTVGVGDGGNEIGMGNHADVVAATESLVGRPCVTKTSELVIASTSNWGGYGLVAALSERSGKNVLASVEHEKEILDSFVEAGLVDGMTQDNVPMVDGFSHEENSAIVQRLHGYLQAKMARN